MRRILFLLLLLYTALLPFERFWRILSSRDSILKPYRIVGLFVLALWLLWVLFSGRRFKFDVGDKCYTLMFGWGILIAIFWNLTYGNEIGYTTHAVQLIAFALAMYMFTKKLELTAKEIGALFVAYAVGLAGSVLWAFSLNESDGRFRGTHNNPNQLGVAAGLCFIFIVAQFLYAHRPTLFWQIVRVAFAIGMVALIGLSGSRGSLFGTAVGTVIVLFAAPKTMEAKRPGFARMMRIGLFAALCAAAVYVGYDRFDSAWEQTASRDRFKEDFAVETAAERWDLWRSGVSVGLDHFGLGAGMMQYLTHHLASIRGLGDVSSNSLSKHVLGTHSDYVDLFACYGIVGVVSYFYYVVALSKRLWRRYLTRAADASSAYLSSLGLGLLGAVLVFEVSMNCYTWCDYFMVMAVAHSIAWPATATERSGIASRASEADEDRGELGPHPTPALT